MDFIRYNAFRIGTISAASLLALFCTNAIAQSEDANESQSTNGQAFSNQWSFALGAGVMTSPTYPGASDKKTRVAPVFNASYNRFFIGAYDGAPTVPFGIGAYFYRDAHWQAGIAISYDFFSPRKVSDDSEKLHGLGDIDRTAHATLFGRYTKDWWAVTASVTTDIGGKDQGTQVHLGAEGRYSVTSKFSLHAGPSITWASAQSNKTFYGISATQSANSGYAQYSPGAGIADVSFGVGGDYQLSKHWNVGARASVSYLPNKISDSPIVGTRTPVSLGAYLGYRF